MPYVKQAQRERLDGGRAPEDAGELNYVLTKIIDDYMVRNGGVRYARLNEVIGALECVKLELYRRVAAPYEDRKMAENGEVYSLFS
jgi:hypothetical protein